MTDENQTSTEQAADIVIAEDDPFISRMYQIKLTGSSYNVVAAGNGYEAAKLIRERQPKVVLLDINMPELGGFEAIEMLKNSGYDLAKTQFIFLTNSTRKEDMEHAKKLGGDYLVKADLTPKRVLELIESKLK